MEHAEQVILLDPELGVSELPVPQPDNWHKTTYQELLWPLPNPQLGKAVFLRGVKNHPNPHVVGDYVWTSPVMSYDTDTRVIVTRNTVYHPENNE